MVSGSSFASGAIVSRSAAWQARLGWFGCHQFQKTSLFQAVSSIFANLVAMPAGTGICRSNRPGESLGMDRFLNNLLRNEFEWKCSTRETSSEIWVRSILKNWTSTWCLILQAGKIAREDGATSIALTASDFTIAEGKQPKSGAGASCLIAFHRWQSLWRTWGRLQRAWSKLRYFTKGQMRIVRFMRDERQGWGEWMVCKHLLAQSSNLSLCGSFSGAFWRTAGGVILCFLQSLAISSTSKAPSPPIFQVWRLEKKALLYSHHDPKVVCSIGNKHISYFGSWIRV